MYNVITLYILQKLPTIEIMTIYFHGLKNKGKLPTIFEILFSHFFRRINCFTCF